MVMDRTVLGLLTDHTDLALAATDDAGRLTVMTGFLREAYGALTLGARDVEMPQVFGLYDADGQAPLAPDDVPLVRARRGEYVRDAVVSSHVGDQLRFFRVNAAPIREDPDGDAVGAVALTQDVTSERAAQLFEEELRDRLVAVINHELRTPVAKLLGFVELLPDQLDDLTPAQRRLLAGIQDAAEELSNLTGTVSALAELHSATKVAEFADVDVSQCVLAAIDATRPAAERKRVELRVGSLPRGTHCRVDPHLVHRAIRALTANAVVYAPAGSTVDIGVESDPLSVDVVVTDAGPSLQGRRGLGLGLADTIAEAHQGRLDLEPADPHGLRARLVLPRPLTP
jgi:signal transduction histidine kinase